MPIFLGKLLTLDLMLQVWGINVQLAGTVEILDIQREVRDGEPITKPPPLATP